MTTSSAHGAPVIGLVGCGNWGRHILRDLVALGCTTHVVARSAASRGRASAGGAASIVATIGDLPRLDGAVVATPTPRHAESIEALLPLGIPIYCEKPLCPSRAEAERLAAAAPDRLFVMDKWRYHPGVLELARIARTGELGAVHGVRSTRVQWGNPHPGLDVIWHLAPHDLSIALEILGTLPEPHAAVVDAPAGQPGTLHGVLGSETPWVVIQVSDRWLPNHREVRLFCEGGCAWLGDSYAETIQVARIEPGRDARDIEPESRPVGTEMPLLAELRAFVTHLRGGPPPRSSAADGVRIVTALSRLRQLAGVAD